MSLVNQRPCTMHHVLPSTTHTARTSPAPATIPKKWCGARALPLDCLLFRVQRIFRFLARGLMKLQPVCKPRPIGIPLRRVVLCEPRGYGKVLRRRKYLNRSDVRARSRDVVASLRTLPLIHQDKLIEPKPGHRECLK